ncbi:MAG: DUF4912 domain-containing protein [Sulfuricurvum sp.]|jgi:hypothetical protein
MNDHDRYTLLQESSKEESISSILPHSTQLLSDEIRVFPSVIEYEIPYRYTIDTLVLMPVNLETTFVYWEITQELFSKYHTTSNHLKTKIFALNEERELAEFPVSTELGTYYLHIEAAIKQVQARMGFYDSDNKFVVILTSNIFSMPNDRIEFSDDEIWMNIDEHTREIILGSLKYNSTDHYSSQPFILEHSRVPILSSNDLIRKGQEC